MCACVNLRGRVRGLVCGQNDSQNDSQFVHKTDNLRTCARARALFPFIDRDCATLPRWHDACDYSR